MTDLFSPSIVFIIIQPKHAGCAETVYSAGIAVLSIVIEKIEVSFQAILVWRHFHYVAIHIYKQHAKVTSSHQLVALLEILLSEIVNALL